MNWEQLLTTKRYGLEDYHSSKLDSRTEFQRDYDRIIFSATFRRLQNKTQVFPLPRRIYVHNRLTHSLEVASVGRSLGAMVSSKLDLREEVPAVQEIGSIVSAACLVHDIGNPPFGHSGEKVLSSYFKEGKGAQIASLLSNAKQNDIENFEGNANAFRLLTHQYHGKRKGGFVLTYSTLASTVKYPFGSSEMVKGKYGFFQSEKGTFHTIAEELGLVKENKSGYNRHPLVYLVEAADDICYQVMDIEDAHNLGILSTNEAFELFFGFYDGDTEAKQRLEKTLKRVDDKNEKTAIIRSMVIGRLVNVCSQIFVDNQQAIMSGAFAGSLIKNAPSEIANAYAQCSSFAVINIYNSPQVLDIEIAGFKVLNTLMEVFTDAVVHPNFTYSKQLIPRIPKQYNVHSEDLYTRIQGVLDFVSGMTDVYALELYQTITGMSIPGGSSFRNSLF